MFSAALCRGLIEAELEVAALGVARAGFPRLYAAASLKHGIWTDDEQELDGFPRLYAAASLKRRRKSVPDLFEDRGFPRLYAAASLKLRGSAAAVPRVRWFSAALCRGLIEALHSGPGTAP